MCNTCCAQLKGIAVMASRHGYGAFAVAVASQGASLPEPHIDPPLPLSALIGPLVFRPGDVVCEMGGDAWGLGEGLIWHDHYRRCNVVVQLERRERPESQQRDPLRHVSSAVCIAALRAEGGAGAASTRAADGLM